MQNLFSFFFAVVVLFFVSCSKDAAFIADIDALPSKMVVTDRAANKTALSSETLQAFNEKEETIELQVINAVKIITTGQYIITFSGDYDFSSAELKAVQELEFTNTSGEKSTLNFEVDSYIGNNGQLQVIFSIGGNSLDGFNLGEAQEIIVEDDVIN